MLQVKLDSRILLLCFTCLVLVVLGTWQVYRYFFKLDLVGYAEYAMDLPVLDYDCERDDELLLKYRRVRVKGSPLCDKMMYVYSRSAHDKKPGYQVLLPLLCQNGNNHILVDMGWVPAKLKGQNNAICDTNNKIIQVEGTMNGSLFPNYFTPDNDYLNNLWYYVDVSKMSSHLDIDLGDLYLVSSGTGIGGKGLYPIGRTFTIYIFNEHLKYAFMWYSMIMIIVILYVMANRKD